MSIRPSKKVSASGLAATAMPAASTPSISAVMTRTRRTTGATPCSPTTRAATIRVSSCSTGKNSPRPTDIRIVQSSETDAMSGLLRL